MGHPYHAGGALLRALERGLLTQPHPQIIGGLGLLEAVALVGLLHRAVRHGFQLGQTGLLLGGQVGLRAHVVVHGLIDAGDGVIGLRSVRHRGRNRGAAGAAQLLVAVITPAVYGRLVMEDAAVLFQGIRIP